MYIEKQGSVVLLLYFKGNLWDKTSFLGTLNYDCGSFNKTVCNSAKPIPFLFVLFLPGSNHQ